jgi:hypothetical protein
MLDGAAARGGPDELDQTKSGELPDVVAHVRERGVQLARDLARARDTIVQEAQDVNT